VKVLDFGIAAMTGHRENIGWIIGTPAYAPPERLRQAPPDPSADVFGLAAILCEMATGEQPFPIHSWEEAARYRHGQPTLPPSVREPALSAIRAALDPSPPRRPTAAALGRALEQAPSPTLIAPAGSVSAAARVPQRTQVYQPVDEPAAVRKGVSPGLIAGAAVAVLAVVIGAIFILGGMFAPEKDPSAGALPSNGPVAGPSATPSPTAAAESVAVLLQRLETAVDAGIAAGHVRERDKARDLRDRVQDLKRVALSQKGNRAKELGNEIRDFQEKLAELANEGDITPQLRADLDAILVQLAAAVSSAR
jgi:eukaryotic-like serine/threonine-protein kinase